MSENVSFKISAIDDFSQVMGRLDSNLGGIQGVADKVGNAGKSMTTKLTTPLVGLATGAALVGANFDTSMSKVQAISGATGSDLESLRNIAKEMGATTQFSASQSAEALQYMALAGWDTEQMVSALPGVLDLAAAGALDLGTASDIMTDSMSMFGMTADDATRASDVFAKAQATSNTDVMQLGEALKYSGASARAAGMDIEQTSAILGIFANNGVKGSSAGTTLDAMFRDLKNSVEDGAVAIGKTNVEVYDATGAMRPMADIMTDIEKATDGMSDAQRDAALSGVFQSQALRGVNILMGEGLDAVYELEAGLYDSAGAGSEMAAVMNDNVAGSFKSMMSAVEGVAIGIYEMFQPALMSIIETITGWVRKFGELDDSTKKTILIIAGIVAAIGPLLMVIGMTITIFTKAIATVKTVIMVVKALGTAMQFLAMNPIGLIIVGIAALIAIGILLYKNWDTVKAYAIAIWGAIAAFFSAFWEATKAMFSSAADWIMDKLTTAWNAVKSVATAVWTAIKTAILTVVNALITTVMSYWNLISDNARQVFDGIKDYFSAVWDLIKNIFLGAILLIINLVTGDFEELKKNAIAIWSNIKDSLSKILTALKQIFSNVLAAIKTVFSTAWDNLKTSTINTFNNMRQRISDAMESAKNTISNVWNAVVNFFTTAIETIKTTVRNGFIQLVSSIAEKMNESKNKIVDIWNTVMTFFKSIDLFQIGKDIIQGLINGIKNMISSVKNVVSDVAKTVTGGIKNALGIKSPSRVMMDLGNDTGAGFIKGIDQMVGGVAKVGEKMAAQPMQRAQAQQSPTVTNNSPVNITLNYSGNGSEEDAMRMIDVIEYELAKRQRNELRVEGWKL